METLKALVAEQASPQEVLLFVVVTVVVCLVVAASIYVGVMTLLWALRLRDDVALRRVFLPTWGQFKRYAGEYLLAFATSILLTLTLAAKHQLVEDLKRLSIQDLPPSDVASLFPIQEMPEGLQARLDGAGSLHAYELLQPVLAAGRVEEAQVFLEGHVGEVRDRSWAGTLDQTTLVAAAIVLSLLYLGWLGMRRFKDLQESPDGKPPPSYEETLRGLLTLAVCIALLLVAPSLVADDEAVAESTLAAVKRMPAEEAGDEGFRRQVHEEVVRQKGLYRHLRLLDTDGRAPENLVDALMDAREDLRQTSDELTRTLERNAEDDRRTRERQDAEIQDLADRLGELADLLGTLEQSAERMGQRLGDAETRIGDVSDRLDSLGQRLRSELASLGRENADLSRQLAQIEARHETDLDEIRSQLRPLDSLVDRLDATEQALRDLQRRFRELDAGVRTTGTLIVFTPEWGEQVTVSGPTTRRTATPAVLELPPGSYRISGQALRTQSAQVERAGVVGVRLEYEVVID